MSGGLDPVLLRGLAAIEPYLDEVVLAGGWVPHVYELMYDASGVGRSPRTRDIDLAVPRSIRVRGRSIDQLLTAADFTCHYTSVSTPPVTKYVASDGGVELEFITDAPGASEAVVAIQPDLTAQQLHYVGLLLTDPWTVNVGDLTAGRAEHSIRVPTPARFLLHKALVFKKRRDRLKAEKDLYYIFFVLDRFPDWGEATTSELARLARHHRAWFTRARTNLARLFESPESVGVDALLNQRPQTAFRDMTDDQFRQYAFSIMSTFVQTMDAAVDGAS